jgi:hypothetical protein
MRKSLLCTLDVNYLLRGTNCVPLVLINCSERSSDAGIVRGTIRDAKFIVPRNKVSNHLAVFPKVAALRPRCYPANFWECFLPSSVVLCAPELIMRFVATL